MNISIYRGGFALVWLGVDKKTGQKYALKQMLKNHSTESQKKELYYGQLLFDEHGHSREEFKNHSGKLSFFVIYPSYNEYKGLIILQVSLIQKLPNKMFGILWS